MTKEESLALSAYIGDVIAEGAPRVVLSPEELAEAKKDFSKEKLAELTNSGLYHGDFELFYTLLRFCDGLGLWNKADGDYLRQLFSLAKKHNRASFRENPYLKALHIQERRLGQFLLTEASYAKGEFFQYDMPPLDRDFVVPRLGFFTEEVRFPAIYEGNMPWVSVCPSEINTMNADAIHARGRVLVLGLGLGYYPFLISEKKEVKTITIVEKSPEIIRLFQEELLPQFPHKEKIRVEEADAFQFLEEAEPWEFDFCYADIWEGWEDGATAYEKILPYEKRLYETQFCYWIEKEIQWFRKEGKST